MRNKVSWNRIHTPLLFTAETKVIMNFQLQTIYPLLVGIWLVAHFVTNECASRTGRHYSTKTVLDDAIPFMPDTAAIYFSGFILGNLAYLLLGSSERFSHIALGYGIQFVVSISLYVLYPCRMGRQENIVPNTISRHLLVVFQRVSKPFNAFPSMHVSYGLFSALSVSGSCSCSEGLVLISWAILVALSALLTRQHYVVDVLVGAALGAGAYLLVL